MQKITPYLWFDNQAEEAANFYVSLFDNSKITSIARYDENSAKNAGKQAGDVMIVSFELNGQNFVALNGGPVFKFTEAISFMIECKDQEEVDKFWNALTVNGGQEIECGWLKDKYGLSWQVVPKRFFELMSTGNPETSKKVMAAMLTIKKFDIAKLEEAANS